MSCRDLSRPAPGRNFDLGEPIHLAVSIPEGLAPIYTKGGGVGPEGWADCFATVSKTANLCCHAGFNILEPDHAPDAWTGRRNSPSMTLIAGRIRRAKPELSARMGVAGCLMDM